MAKNEAVPEALLAEVARLKEKHTRKEIAEMLGLTERQVKRYLHNYRKVERIRRQTEVKMMVEGQDEVMKPSPKEGARRDPSDVWDLAREFEINFEKPNEKVNYWDLTNCAVDNEIIIVFLGDVHWGSPHCNRYLLFQLLDWIHSKPNAYVLLMGDLLEASTKVSVGAGVYEQVQAPQQQYKDTLKYLRLIQDRLLGAFIGNHEFRLVKDVGVNLIDIMCDTLEIPYLGYTALTTIRAGDIEYDIVGTHGMAGSRKPHTKLAKTFDLADLYDADLYVMAHMHDKVDATKEYRRRIGRELEIKMRHYLVTGHFLTWKGSYAEMAAMTPSSVGAPYAILRTDKFDIKVIK